MTLPLAPHYTLSGSPTEIGQGHGESLRAAIAETIAVYRQLFMTAGIEEASVLQRAGHFREVIKAFNPDYGQEIEGIAAAANQPALWIYALNARSEMMSSKVAEAGECTALFFHESAVLAQNWDWVEAMEPLVALFTVRQASKPEILMMTEPGLIGKIGMNDRGLGLCFNFLSIDKPTRGLPLHVTNRAVLECASLAEARQAIAAAGTGKSGNLLVGHHSGQGFDLEFAGDRTIEPPADARFFTHTNHFVDRHYLSANAWLAENSQTRQRRVEALCERAKSRSVDAAKVILGDGGDAQHPLLRPYERIPELGIAGTVCTMVMDLKQSKMHFRLGNNPTAPFQVYSLPRADA